MSIPSCSPVLDCLRVFYVVFAFCAALFLGALKGVLIGPIASSLLILGNCGVILGFFPAHVVWTVYALIKTKRFDSALKIALLFALPPLFGLYLGLGVAGSVVVGVGYGFFTPWVSTFEAFRHDRESSKFLHCIADGTWGTIKGSCTVVRDFADLCYHSYPLYLKEMREGAGSNEPQTIRLVQVPACILVGLMGLIVEVPLFTAISVIKSPYMLFKGWQRLLHDLVSREGPFLETACVPVAGLAILLWPLVVIGSILLSIFSSIFVGLYGSVVVYQERSFRRGVAYVIAMVSEFDEYTNDWLYLREGSFLPKPRYRKKRVPHSSDFSLGGGRGVGGLFSSRQGENTISISSGAPGNVAPSLGPARSVREQIQEVKMVQIWEDMMRACEMRGRELVDANAITKADLNDWSKSKSSREATIVGIGLPSYCTLQNLLYSIKAGGSGLYLCNGVELTHQNRPQDLLIDWFFYPLVVLRDQIKAIKLSEDEIRFLEKFTLLGSNTTRMECWNNGSVAPQDTLRTAQIEAIGRRLQGMTRSISKFPTYRRRYCQVVKALTAYCLEREGISGSVSSRSVASIEITVVGNQ